MQQAKATTRLPWLSFLEGLGGTVHGSFFNFQTQKQHASITPTTPVSSSSTTTAADSDHAKDASTPVASPLISIHQCTISSQIRNYITLTYFLYTPNLIWFLLALTLWCVVPYPKLDSNNNNNDSISYMSLLKQRLIINLLIVWLYYGFWHVTLYGLQWGRKPWISQHRTYRWTKVLHNMWYTTLGILQWTVTETALLHVTYYSLPLQQQQQQQVCSNPQFSSWWWFHHALVLLVFVLAVPVIRDVHFYTSHRLLHVRFLYKYLHSLHHRNTDVEPFSGLSMHPTEHLYYFTCYGPWLWLWWWCLYSDGSMENNYNNNNEPHCYSTSYHYDYTIGLFWMGLHVVLSPAASHSGFSDHWQADLYHYLHHRYFDCNYASPALPFDKWMGTFRDKLDDKKKKNDGDHTNSNSNSSGRLDAKASIMWWGDDGGGLSTRDEIYFYLLGVVLPVTVLMYCCRNDTWRNQWDHRVVAMILTTSPLMAAALLHAYSFRPKTQQQMQQRSSWWKHYMAPFHEDSVASLILHFVIGAFVCCIFPLYCLLSAILSPTMALSK